MNRRGILSSLSLAVFMAAVAPARVSAAPQMLRITHARLDKDSAQAGSSGRFLLKAIVDDTADPGSIEAALLANSAEIIVADAGQFNVPVPLTSCRRVGSAVRCKSGPIRARLRRTAMPAVFQLRLSIRQLGSSGTGLDQPRTPVRATLQRPGGPDIVDVISDCAPVGLSRLDCRDLGRPNIVLIVSDDQRADTLQYMPRTLERLAADGVTFTNALVSTPLCAPSRASILTGNYARHHGVLVNGGTGGAPAFVGPDASTLATWLRDSGYRTGMYGKYFTNYTAQCPPTTTSCYIPPGWDEWHVMVQQAYYNYKLAENQQITPFGATAEEYSTDVIAARSVDFIHSAAGQPFFLHVGFHAPHQEGGGPAIPAARHLDSYTDLSPWRPPSYDEEDISDKPPWLALQPRAATVFGSFFTYGLWGDYVRTTQIQSLLAVDDAIDAMMSALEATGQADNTVFVFTSDNGYEWGEHRYFFGKSVPYEQSVRVPLVIRYPRLQSAGRQESRLALNIDLAPTLAELAGVAPPPSIDGVSLVALIRNQPTTPRNDAVIEFWSNTGQIALFWAGLRTPEWKYVPYANDGAGEVELYDLVNDPYELDNRAHDPNYADEVTALHGRLDALLGGTE